MTQDNLIARLDKSVSELCDLHRKMLNAVRKDRPYPVSIRLGQSDTDAVLNGALALEHAKADLIERLSPPLDAKERPMAEFQREERYLVIKRKHLTKAREEALRAYLFDDGIETVECVVVEKDWPEYEPVWAMIEQRCGPRPNLDGEGVIQADRDRVADYWMPPPEDQEDHLPWVRRADAARAGKMDDDALVQAFAAHRRAATISTPREDEVERVAKAIAVALPRMREVPFEHWSPKLQDETRILARAAIAALTPREQIRAEADDWLVRQLENWPTRVDPEKTTNIEFLMKEAAKVIRALSSLPAPLSLQDET